MNKVIKILYARIQKSAVKTLCLLGTLFFMLSGCENKMDKKNTCNCDLPPDIIGMSANCIVKYFLEGVSEYSNCSNTYVIKGVALDMYEYGRNIRFVEDLKGNFPENVNTFIVWGDGGRFGLERSDNLSIYNEQDVLIMHLAPAEEYQFELLPGETWLEKPGDYRTFTCTKCVLKLSDGYVTGNILPNEDGDGSIMSMSWNDFQKALQKALTSNQ